MSFRKKKNTVNWQQFYDTILPNFEKIGGSERLDLQKVLQDIVQDFAYGFDVEESDEETELDYNAAYQVFESLFAHAPKKFKSNLKNLNVMSKAAAPHGKQSYQHQQQQQQWRLSAHQSGYVSQPPVVHSIPPNNHMYPVQRTANLADSHKYSSHAALPNSRVSSNQQFDYAQYQHYQMPSGNVSIDPELNFHEAKVTERSQIINRNTNTLHASTPATRPQYKFLNTNLSNQENYYVDQTAHRSNDFPNPIGLPESLVPEQKYLPRINQADIPNIHQHRYTNSQYRQILETQEPGPFDILPDSSSMYPNPNANRYY